MTPTWPRPSPPRIWCWTACSGSAARAGCASRTRRCRWRAGQAAAPARAATVVAVDLPSGVDADTGVVDGGGGAGRRDGDLRHLEAGAADRPGRGLRRGAELVDIGLGPYLPRRGVRFQAADMAALLPAPTAESDKYRRGSAGMVVGQRAIHRRRSAGRRRSHAGRGGHGAACLGPARGGRGPAVGGRRRDQPCREPRVREGAATAAGHQARIRPGGSRPGWPGLAWAPTRRPRSGWPRCWAPTCPSWSTRTG